MGANAGLGAIGPDAELQYHIKCKRGDLARYVLLPGDPDRVPVLGAFWDSYEEVSRNREFRTARGLYKGVPVSACSTGIGGPSAEIAIVELSRIGCDTFIRVGTTGAIRPEIKVGDLIINVASLRMDGASDMYVRKEYPAFASYEVSLALVEACETLGFSYHVGVGATCASFYAGQSSPSFGEYWQSYFDSDFKDLVKMGVTNYEMEAATVLVLASLAAKRAGVICGVVDNRITGEFSTEGIAEKLGAAANEAVRMLKSWDDLKEKKKKRFIFPAMLFEAYAGSGKDGR